MDKEDKVRVLGKCPLQGQQPGDWAEWTGLRAGECRGAGVGGHVCVHVCECVHL